MTDFRIFEQPKIDCHVHVFDPARFPYRADTHYAPGGQELGTPAQLEQVGVAWNATYYGVGHYRNGAPLLKRLADLGMFVDIQVEHEQLIPLLPLVRDCGARILVDHCGRPTIEAGLDQPGFRALLELGETGRAFVKLSGYVKFSRNPVPHEDTRPFVRALVDAFTADRCLWGSDRPYLRAPGRADYGVGLALELFPDVSIRRKLMWDTPRELFGFAS